MRESIRQQGIEKRLVVHLLCVFNFYPTRFSRSHFSVKKEELEHFEEGTNGSSLGMSPTKQAFNLVLSWLVTRSQK
jgi:hypothetical protein